MDDWLKQCIKEVKAGDPEAFAQIVEAYKDKVYQIAYRMVGNAQEAQDVAQEAFIRAYTNIDRYDTNRKFSTWLFRIATNLSIDKLRKKKPDYSLDAEVSGTEGLDGYSQLAATDALPDEQVVTLEWQASIQEEINALPPKYRAAIILKYMEDLSLQEMSEILDLPVGTIKTHVHRGREALRKRLKKW
ncbi:RNA polymerase sigma factor SigW [Geomicrobium sp. JCM 19037]|uniref:RNA polymerase sigma factor SigW n=1 Tax=unclassified Geomicrobium TaxID=2628951 RepID=UPI00045F2B8D|nr:MULTISPECIES: RNA polymerase sigma factor SigW [unclassified Geomicrobium]GAK04540.1 RNA polymerase sigma factor SigW [Geomicrobium sp. JCM 19037]GAK10410.1 RNA polymerase sigma factor SigW [Geomicrobium sp. JCM 19039]